MILNSLGSIGITWAQKNCIINLHNFWADQRLETRDWLMVMMDISEAWVANPVTMPMRPAITHPPIDYD